MAPYPLLLFPFTALKKGLKRDRNPLKGLKKDRIPKKAFKKALKKDRNP